MSTVHYVAVLGQSNAEALFNFYGDDQSGATELAASLSSSFLGTGADAVSASAVRGMLNGVGTTNKFATASNVLVENLAVGATIADGNASGINTSLAWWFPDSNTPGQLLLTAIARINTVLSALQAAGTEVVLSVVWAQGEADGKLIMDGQSDATTYKEATTELLSHLTTQVTAPFDIYLQEVGVTAYLGGDARWNGGQDIIRNVQREIAMESDRIHIAAVTEDMPLRDHVHISEESYELAGRRLADYINYDKGYSSILPSPRPPLETDLGPVVDQPPVARADTAQASLAVTSVTGNVLSNDYDPDRDAISVVSVGGQPVSSDTASVIIGQFGTLTINASGSYVYLVNIAVVGPGSFANGPLQEAFTYQIRDQDNFTAETTLTLKIVSVPDTVAISGTLNGDTLSGTAGNDVILGLGGNDTIKGREGDDRIYGGAGVDTIEGNGGNDVIVGGEGADKLKGSGGTDIFVIRSQAEAGDVIADWGAAETLDLTGIFAGSGATSAASLISSGQLQIRSVAGGSEVWAVLGGATFLVAAMTGTAAVTASQIKVSNTTLYTDDGYAAPGYGTPSPIQPRPPEANADQNLATPTVPSVSGNVLSNDTDPDSDALSVVSVDSVTVAEAEEAIVQGLYGTLTIQRDGSYSYVVDPAKVGPGQGNLQEVFTYIIRDTANLADSATLTITVVRPETVPEPLPPVAVDDVNSASTANATVSGNVVTNDTDPTQDLLTVVSASGQAVTDGAPTIVTGLYGTLTINADGSYSYAVDASKVPMGTGTFPDVFNYTISDLSNLTDTGALTITVSAIPPVNNGDTDTNGGVPPAGAIVGTNGVNRLTGTVGDDRMYGLDGADTLKGGLGNDIIFGGAGADLIEGNDGADTIYGGTGNDQIKGGSGADIYVFSDGDGFDTLAQFRREDRIVLENSYFTNKADALAAIVAGPQAGTFVLHYSPTDSITFSDTTQVELAGAVWVFGSANIV